MKGLWVMKPIDPTVKKETRYIAFMCVLFSLLLQAVFLVLSKWTVAVLLGNLLGIAAAVGNFLLMGLTVQNALEKEEDEAKRLVKSSQSFRLAMMFVVALIGYLVPCFHAVAVVVPFLFPRLAIALRPLLIKE